MLVEDLLHFIRWCIGEIASHRTVERHAERVVAALFDDRVVVGLDLLFPFRSHRLLYGRHDEIRGALEHRDVRGSLRHDWQHLHGRCATADDADALTRIVQAFGRPAGRVEARTLELAHAFELRDHRLGDHAHRADEVLAGVGLAIGRLDQPEPRRLLEIRSLDLGVQLDVRPHVAAIGDEVHVLQVLFPPGVAHRPLPLLQQLLRERQAVVVALAVTGSAGIAIPGPGAADVGRLVEHADRQTRFTHVMNQRKASEARAYRNDVVIRFVRRSHRDSPESLVISVQSAARTLGRTCFAMYSTRRCPACTVSPGRRAQKCRSRICGHSRSNLVISVTA